MTDKVTLSDLAAAVKAVYDELEIVENAQLTVSEQMAKLIYEQVRLSRKALELNDTLKTLMKGHLQ